MFKTAPISAFNDNYIWALVSEDAQSVAVIDPGDAAPVETFLQQQGLTLSAILVTHHHGDHTGGINALMQNRDIPVYGPARSPFKGITHPLTQGDQVELYGNVLEVTEVPGHTLDHISYCCAGETPQVFCGDTLFLAGCGRIFEGSATQMFTAMEYYLSLPDTTQVYCTHEYSLNNLRFAAAVEPDNAAIEQSIRDCQNLRDQDKPTLPTSIGAEKLINPFLRSNHESVAASATNFAAKPLNTPLDVFTAVREWKNVF